MIIVGGEALIDLLLAADGGLTFSPGGGPYNTARTIGRLGLPVAFVGGLSSDRFGRRLHAGLVRDGVDLGLATSTGSPTTLAVAELDDAGVATYRFYTEGTSAVAVDAATPPAFAGRIVTAVHVGTLGLVLEPLASAMEILVGAAPDEALVMLDPNCRPAATADPGAYRARVDRLLPRTDIVKVSGEDLDYLRPGVPRDVAVRGLLDAGPSIVLWTEGGAAVRVVTGRGTTTIAPPPVRVIDTVGAGDAFGGGFLAAWIGSGNGRAELESDEVILASAVHAARVASFTCTRPGAEPPTSEELAAWGGGE